MHNRRYYIYTLLFIFLVSTIPLFPAHKVNKVIQIPYGGFKGPSISKTFSGNYGITSFAMVSKEEIALLHSVDMKVMIYNTISKQLTKEFFVDDIPRDLIYSDDMFYVLTDYRISGYRRDGVKIIDFPINRNFKFVDRIHCIDNSMYLFTSDGRSYKVFENGSSISPDRQIEEPVEGWIFENDLSFKVEKGSDSEFEVYCYREGELIKRIPFQTGKKVGCISIIGLVNKTLYLDIQYVVNDIPLDVERNIMAFSLQADKILDEFELPHCYFLYTKRDLLVHENELYNMVTTEKDLTILVLSYERSLARTIYPIEFSKSYHYNNHLPKIENEFQIEKSGKQSGFAYDPIRRSEILSNADAYVALQWYCSSENSSNNEIIRLPDSAYIRTPAWVVEGDKTSVPYKWGGFTHIDNFTNGISLGAYGGDNYTSRTDPWAVSYGDTYCVGLDCSGYVSRVWGLSGKEWTGSLPNISISLQYWSKVLKGDILNKSGSHVMLVVENNPSGTIDVVHASGYDWKVAYWTFTLADLTGYIPRKYMYVINDLAAEETETELFQNYPNPFSQTTTISFYLPDPTDVSLTVYNLNGKIVGSLINGIIAAGENSFEWHVGKLPAGVYIYKLRTAKFTQTKRCVIVK